MQTVAAQRKTSKVVLQYSSIRTAYAYACICEFEYELQRIVLAKNCGR